MPVHTTHDLSFSATTVTKRYSRWDHGEPAREWGALTLLHGRRPELVPEPLSCDLGDSAPYVTMSRLPGVPLGRSDARSEDCLDAVAAALTKLHHTFEPGELANLPTRRWDASTGIEDVRAWAAEEQSSRRTTSKEPPLSACAEQALVSGLAWIQPAPARLAGPPAHPVFARADGNAANLLWDGTVVRLVDFEDAGRGDLAYEVADAVEHLSVWSDAGIEADALLDRFDLAKVDRHRVAEYRRLFALFWLLMLLPGNPADHRNPSGTRERQAERLLGLL